MFKKNKSVAGSMTGTEKQTTNKKKQAANKNKKKKDIFGEDQNYAVIGKNRSFAVTEAHKRLRTNVMFSFADEGECHVIGVTSSLAHEGKSTTSMNLAYDLMKAGKKTLLIDADMRLSKVAKSLGVHNSPGLSNMLVSKTNDFSMIQHSASQDGLHVITCGDIPPNPTELLASKRFELMLGDLREEYEYIVIDLPPITEVADALIVSQFTDGIIVVVRQAYADKRMLDDTIMQLDLNGARIIGLIMTCVENASKYGKYKYKKYSINKFGYHGGYSGHHGYYSRGYYSRGHYSHHGYYSSHGHRYYEKHDQKSHHETKHTEDRDV